MSPCFPKIKTVVTTGEWVSEVNATGFAVVLSIPHDSSNLLPQESTEVSERKNQSVMLPVMLLEHSRENVCYSKGEM